MKAKKQLLVFAIEDQQYALDLSVVERVIRAVEVKPLPRVPGMVAGVINVQGRILPVLDVRRQPHRPECLVGVNDRFIIVRLSGRRVAFVVNAVIGLTECQEEKMTSTKSILSGVEHIEGVFNTGGEMVLVHDPVRFLNPEEERVLDHVTEQT